MIVKKGSGQGIQDHVAHYYSSLSGRLREAADYVVANPVDVATRSLRQISVSTGLAPATFTRLAKSMEFESFEQLRDLCRNSVEVKPFPFSEKAARLVRERDAGESQPFLHRHISACITNIDVMSRHLDLDALERSADFLVNARNVVLFGAYSSTGIVDYFSYLSRYFAPQWRVAGHHGGSLSASLTGLDERDAMVLLTKAPFAKRGILAAKMASDHGVRLMLITDNHSCPALDYAETHFIIPSDSPQFFSSYVASLVLIETLIGMLVSRAGPQAKTRIEEIETSNRRYGEFWE